SSDLREERAKPVFYGVECFTPTLIDFYSVEDDTRMLWSSREHRKTFSTLSSALDRHGPHFWLCKSWSLWASLCSLLGAALFLYASRNEIGYPPHATTQSNVNLTEKEFPLAMARQTIDIPLLAGVILFLFANVLTYLEVINCCHDLNSWLFDYTHGLPSIRKMKLKGYYPYRIDFWIAVFGILGWLFLLQARIFILRYELNVFGVINLTRGNPRIFYNYWIPSLIGYFSLSMSAYFQYVEALHRWFVCRPGHLEFWVTGLNWTGIILMFTCSFFQFIDPFNLFMADNSALVAFEFGSWCLLASSVLGIFEVNALHSPLRHPVYGKLRNEAGTFYGSI
ncbi:hypothetical protein THRCLA_22253, partial [Thraustotheca clavata]